MIFARSIPTQQDSTRSSSYGRQRRSDFFANKHSFYTHITENPTRNAERIRLSGKVHIPRALTSKHHDFYGSDCTYKITAAYGNRSHRQYLLIIKTGSSSNDDTENPPNLILRGSGDCSYLTVRLFLII